MSRLFKLTAALALLLPPVSVSAQQMMQPPPPMPAGTRAPAFSTTTVGGKPLTLKSLRGKVVLLDYWATWCGPCQAATPILEALHERFGNKGLAIVGMSVDDSHSLANIKPYMKRFGVTYIITASPVANERAHYLYRASDILPAQFLIDKKGIVRWSQAGFPIFSPQLESRELTPLIKRLLVER